MLAQASFSARRKSSRRGCDPYEALRADGGIRSIIESSTANWPTSPTSPSSTRTGSPSRTTLRRSKGSRWPSRKTSRRSSTAAPLDADARGLLRIASSRSGADAGRRPAVRRDPGWRDDHSGSQRAQEGLWRAAGADPRGADRVVALRDAALAVDASADSRDPERPVAARTRRAGRHARSARSRSSATWEARSTRSARSCPRSAAAESRMPRPPKSRPGAPTDLESVMDNLEDAVALFSPRGELIFCNKSMNALQPRALDSFPPTVPVKQIVERTLAGRKVAGARLDLRARSGRHRRARC